VTAAPKKRRARGEGGLSQRANGLWVGRIELPTGPDGKRRQKVVTDRNQREVVRKLAALRADLARNGDLPTASMTLSKWLDYWIENVNQSRPRTRAGYRSKIKYIDQAIGRIRLDRLTAADVRSLEQHIVGTLKLSPTSALQAYQILAKALKDAERDGRVTRNVARLVDPPRRALAQLRILTAEEGIAVLRTVANDRLGSRWAAALLLGARQGELLGLEWDRVDLDEGVIDLSWQLQAISWRHGCSPACGRKQAAQCPARRLDAPHDWEHRHLRGTLYLSRPKSKAGWRIIPLTDPLLTILRRHRAATAHESNPFGLVWTRDASGAPINPSADSKAWHAALAASGVPDARLHDARHTAVTILYDLGVPETVIQDIVGQSTISTTRSYRHKQQNPMRAALEQLGARLQNQIEGTTP
jgi:integrase